jgi:flagellum-specific peptidoglycan hydrolase FlgJ
MTLWPWAVGLAALGLAAGGARLALQSDGSKRALAVQTVAPAALDALQRAKVPQLLPLAVAQAMLETGWGRAVPGGNWYGIKGRGPAGSVNVPTREEFTPGVVTRQRSNFRRYANARQSAADWVAFITHGRYAPARSMGPGGAALWVWAMGYATASGYVAALARFAATAAKVTGQPRLALHLTPGQRELAATLAALPAGGPRRRAAVAVYRAGRWPS